MQISGGVQSEQGRYREHSDEPGQETWAVTSMVFPRPPPLKRLRRRRTRLRHSGCAQLRGPKSVEDDRNNRLLNFAVDNSDAVEELLSHAKADAEKAEIKDKAKQSAVYSLDDTIVVNSKSEGRGAVHRAVVCPGWRYDGAEGDRLQGGAGGGWQDFRFGDAVSVLIFCRGLYRHCPVWTRQPQPSRERSRMYPTSSI